MNRGCGRSSQVNRRVVFYRLRYSIQFSLRCKSGSDVGSIVGSITHESQRIRFSLGYRRISVIHWDSRRQRVLPTCMGYSEINREIDRIVERVHLFFTTSSKNTFSHTDPVSTLNELQTHLFPDTIRTTTSNTSYGLTPMFNRFLREHSNGGWSLPVRHQVI